MYVLGVETATPVASVALATRGAVLAERMVLNQRTHSVNLLPMIRDVLGECGLAGKELSGIAVSSGPGSFTGLRIGMGAAKALAQVWGLPCAAVPTLEAMVQPLAGTGALACPLLNARKGEVYAALYHCKSPRAVCLWGPVAADPRALAGELLPLARPVLLLGEGALVYAGIFKELMGEAARFAPAAASFPRGGAVAELGIALLEEGKGTSPHDLRPEYVRLPEAEVLWRKKQENREREITGNLR